MVKNISKNITSSILVVDDDVKLGELVKTYLTQFSFKVVTAVDSETAMDALAKERFDLIILDIMLPGINGVEFCKLLRKDTSIPIIMLSARGEMTDKVVGLEIGADDYLAKPFEPRELLARIHSILRRTYNEWETKESDIITVNNITVNMLKRFATKDGDNIALTNLEFELLYFLMLNKGKIVSRDSLVERLHEIEWEAYNRSVDVLLSRLRNKLGDDPKNPMFIKTIWGKGYMFIA